MAFALASVVVLVGAMALLDRTGARAPAPLARGAAPSGAWLCPHGGASDLSVQLYLANPGPSTVTARITRLGSERARSPESHEVAAGSTVRIDQVPPDRGAATYVEYFGGWIGAGWVYSKEGWDDLPEGVDDPMWLGIGYVLADLGGLILLISLIVGGVGMYRLRAGNGAGLLKTTLVLSLVLVAAYLVAAWAMTGKPDYL